MEMEKTIKLEIMNLFNVEKNCFDYLKLYNIAYEYIKQETKGNKMLKSNILTFSKRSISVIKTRWETNHFSPFSPPIPLESPFR